MKNWKLERRHKLLSCLVLFIASVMLYSPAFKFDFSRYDDHRMIGEHPHLYADGTISDRIRQIVYQDFPREEPLVVRDLSWLLDSIVFGYNRPFGYHYGNVFYHSIALVLAFLLLLRLTSPATALISASVLLVLAAHVEPVAWIMGRKDVLSAMFTLLSILLFLGFQDARRVRWKACLYAASLVFFAAATLSKINAVVHVGILYLCALINDGQVLRKGIGIRGLFRLAARTLVPVVPFIALGLGVFVWYQSVVGEYGLFDNALRYAGDEYRKIIFLVNPLIFLEYLKILLFPWNLEAYYTAPSLFTEFSVADMAQAGVVLALTIGAVAWLWRFNRTSCLLFLCFLIALLPYGNWVHFGFWYANRYAYFGSFFLIAALTSLVVGIQALPRARLAKSLAILLLAWVFAHNLYYRTQYLEVWENGVTLWTHETSLPTASINDYINLTATYIGEAEAATTAKKEGWLEKARSVNEKIFELEIPSHEKQWLPIAHFHKGLILAYSDAPLEAQMTEFSRAANASSGFARAQWSTGVVYYQMALREADQALREELAKQSLVYVQRYFETRGKDARARKERRDFLEQFQRDFPDVSLPRKPGE